MVSFKDKNVERAVEVVLALAIACFIVFLIFQMIGEDRAAAEFFRNR
jgi:hypothetical protein